MEKEGLTRALMDGSVEAKNLMGRWLQEREMEADTDSSPVGRIKIDRKLAEIYREIGDFEEAGIIYAQLAEDAIQMGKNDWTEEFIEEAIKLKAQYVPELLDQHRK